MPSKAALPSEPPSTAGCWTRGRSSLNGYCDLEKLYDSISLVKLIHHAQAAGFPSVALSLVLQIHLATRILRVNNWVSNPILPCTGIVAGCRSSGHLARVIVYPVLQKMHEAYIPKSLHFRCFFDDLVLKICEDSDATTLAFFVDSFHEIISDLKHRRLKHSEAKTVIRSKDKALANKAVKRLADLGTVVKSNLPVADLGTPVSCGTRRLANQARKRLTSAKRAQCPSQMARHAQP